MLPKPIEVECLASYIAEEMEARGWTTWEVAMGMSDKRSLPKRALIVDLLLCVQDDKLIIDDALCSELAHAFDVSPELFIGLHRLWKRNPDRRIPFQCPEHLLSQ